MTESSPIETEIPWRRLHPASLAVNVVPQAWRTARSAWPLLLALFIGGEGAGIRAVDLMVFLLFTGLTVATTVVHWVTLRYRMHDERLEIRSGLLYRHGRTIDPSRIQNIELVRNIFHRWSGLVELRIETAGDSSTEGLLSALSVSEAGRLRDALRVAVITAAPTTDEIALETTEDRDPLVSLTTPELLAYGFSRRTIGTVAVLTAVGFEVLGQLGPETTREVAGTLQASVLIGAVLLAFAGSWIVSAGAAVFRHHRFALRQEGNKLVTEEGLATRRRVEIPLGKVQLLRADEPMVRRWMGYATLLIETAGLGIADGRVRQAEGVIPMVAREELGRITARAAPRAGVDPWSRPLLPAHRRALYRAAFGAFMRATLVAIPLALITQPWGWAFLLLIPFSIPAAWLDWNRQGWLITDTAIVARRGFFTRRTWILAREKIQSVHMVQGPLMRWHGLGRIVVRVAGSQVCLPDIGTKRAHAIVAELAP